jgi:hypothetical protein
METSWKEGDKLYSGPFETIGHNRYFETRAFHADASDTRWHDADVCRGVDFDSLGTISEVDADDKANDMHEAVVTEITEKLERGELNNDN